MPTPLVRPAEPTDHDAVAALRWRWTAERHGPPDIDRDEFVSGFAAWARQHASSHRCLVLVRDDQVLGMAFLAIVARVPRPPTMTRASGDVQCVYVLPEERDQGLGGLLIDAVLRLAAELGLERVTVHSSARAVTAYRRHGLLGERLMSATVEQREIVWSHESARNVLAEFLRYDRRMRFVGEYLPKVDGATMHYALEARSPFLDQELWESAAALPYEVRLRRGQLKAVLREIARRRLGDRVAGGAQARLRRARAALAGGALARGGRGDARRFAA